MVFVTLVLYLFALLVLFLNAWRILRLNALLPTRERPVGEKKAPLSCGPKNHPGLSLSRFWLLPGFVCQRPHVCDFDLLFLAVILVG